MLWEDRYQSFQVAQTVNRTVGGRAIVYATPLKAGRKITFKSTQDSGWIDKTTVELLMGMAATVGSTFLLELGEENTVDAKDANGNLLLVNPETYNVIFRHNEPPALEINPIVGRAVQASGDYFFGTIKLLTI
jgi:hypothetical protein